METINAFMTSKRRCPSITNIIAVHLYMNSYFSLISLFREAKQKMLDEKLAEEKAKDDAKKKRQIKNPFKKRPKTREEKIEAWLEN